MPNTKTQPHDVSCPTCGMPASPSTLKCPRCNTLLIKLEGCDGACFSCVVKSHCSIK